MDSYEFVLGVPKKPKFSMILKKEDRLVLGHRKHWVLEFGSFHHIDVDTKCTMYNRIDHGICNQRS